MPVEPDNGPECSDYNAVRTVPPAITERGMEKGEESKLKDAESPLNGRCILITI